MKHQKMGFYEGYKMYSGKMDSLESLNLAICFLRSATHRPADIKRIEGEIRSAFHKLGEPVLENSSTDKDIKKAVCESHLLNGECRLKHLHDAAAAGVVSPDNIDSIYEELYEHFKCAGALPSYHPIINEARVEALLTSADAILMDFEKREIPCSSEDIRDRIMHVFHHREAGGQPVETGTEFLNRVWDAAGRMCRVSGLSDTKTEWIFDQIEKYLKERDEKAAERRMIDEAIERTGKTAFIPPEGYISYSDQKTAEEQALGELYGINFKPNRPYKRSHGTWYTPVGSRRKILIYNHNCH